MTCSHAPLVFSARNHDKQGLLLVLLRRISVRCARACLLLSLCASTMNGVLLLSSWEELSFSLLARTSCSLSAWSQWTRSSSFPFENHHVCRSRAPLVPSTHKNCEWGILLVPVRRIPVSHTHASLLFSPRVSTSNGVFLLSNWEAYRSFF